jgi:hypothetical protein
MQPTQDGHGERLTDGLHSDPMKRREMTPAFPWDTAPRYLPRDRDKSYGPAFRHRVRAMGITEVITAPAEPICRAIDRFDPS